MMKGFMRLLVVLGLVGTWICAGLEEVVQTSSNVEGMVRALATDESWVIRSGKVHVLVLVLVPKSQAGVTESGAYWDSMINDLGQVHDFFMANSGNKLNFNFVMPKKFWATSLLPDNGCAKGSSQCPTQSMASAVAREFATSGESPYSESQYERVLILFRNGCECLPCGSAPLVGRNVLIGCSDTYNRRKETWAHELGHTCGANHAGFEDKGYGSPFSVMGAFATLPGGHFSVVGKVAFNWLDPAQHIASFGRTGHPECPPLDGGSCYTSREIAMHAHDLGGGYSSNELYGARVYTGQPGMYLWLEFRKQPHSFYGQPIPAGMVMTLSTENAAIGPKRSTLVSTYGPTTVLDYRPDSFDSLEETDVVIPPGQCYVYDLDNTGVKICVDRIEGNRIYANVDFVPRTFEFDYAFSPDSPSPVRESLYCNDHQKIDKSKSDDLRVYRMFVAQPVHATLKTLPCMLGSKSVNLGRIYVYPFYPLQVINQAPETRDPLVGSMGNFQVKCDQNTHSIELDFQDSLLPMSLEYYFIFFEDQENSMIDSIWIHSECKRIENTCRANFYSPDGGQTCLQCPLGSTSKAGATSRDDCKVLKRVFDLELSSNSKYDGEYVQAVGTHNERVFFIRNDGKSEVSYLFSNGGTWALSLESEMLNDVRPVSTGIPSSLTHPALDGNVFEDGNLQVIFTPKNAPSKSIRNSSPPLTTVSESVDFDTYVDTTSNLYTMRPNYWKFQNAPTSVRFGESSGMKLSGNTPVLLVTMIMMSILPVFV